MTNPKVIPTGISITRHRASAAWGNLDEEERNALEASVAQQGVLEPVLAFEVFDARGAHGTEDRRRLAPVPSRSQGREGVSATTRSMRAPTPSSSP